MQRRSRAPRRLLVVSLIAIAIGSVVGAAVVMSWPPTVVSPSTTSSDGPSTVALGAPTGTAGRASSTAAARSSGAPFASSPPPATTPSPRPKPAPAETRHVWWIVMENHEYGSIIGNDAAPYLNALASRYELATTYYATSHPSEPNYIALVAGSTLGVTSDGVYHLARSSLFSQLADAGRPWRLYAQDDPAGCFTGTIAVGGRDGPGAPGTYARKHNPAISFTSVAGSPAQCRNIQPLRTFDPAIAAFEMIVPNLTNDMHDGSIGQGDSFLHLLVPQIIASPAFEAGSVLFITFDEGTTNAGSLGDDGGHVATLIISPDVRRGDRYRAYADHWSLLRTTERILGLPCLANACRRSAIPH